MRECWVSLPPRELQQGVGSGRWGGEGAALRRTVAAVEGGRVGGPGR